MVKDNRRSNKAKANENIKSKEKSVYISSGGSMKKIVKQDASPASNSRRSSRDLAADNSRGKKVTGNENITPKKKTITPNASPASSSRRSSTSSRKETKETPGKDNPTNMRRSVRLENMNPSDTPQSRVKSKKTQEEIKKTPVSDRRKKLVEKSPSSNTKSKKKKAVKSLDQSMTDTSENKKQGKPSLGADGRKRKKGRKKFFSRVKQKKAVPDGDKAKDSEESLSEAVTSSSSELVTELEKPDKLRQVDKNDNESEEKSSEANSSSNSDVAMEDKLHPLDSNKTEYSVSKSVEDKDDNDDECSDRKASKSHCREEENNVKELLDDYLMDLDKAKHVGSLRKSVDGESIGCGSGEDSSSESKKSPKKQKTNHASGKQHELKYCETSGSEDRTTCEAAGLAETVEKSKGVKNMKSSAPLVSGVAESNSSKFVEFRVPVQISNVQLEQYCSMLLSNAMALSSCSKTDTVGAVHDILVSNRKGVELGKFLDVGIKASGKLQFLDLILPELRKRELRVLILYQPLSGSGKGSPSIGDILDDFLRQRFGEDSYERIDGVGIVPSKKQAALNNFNNKDMGRFVFLLEYRACLPSIKLSSVDTVIVFNSEWNPANDLRALNKIAIDSQSEQIMIFRLYTSSTLEEKILRLAEHNVTIDSKLQNISRSTSDALLMWGATYLFNKLDEFHNASGVNTCSEECLLDELLEEFINLITHVRMNKDATKLMITRAQPVREIYGKNPTVPNKSGEEQPHTFWRKLLVGRDPCWKYLAISNPRQRKIKRPQYFEQSPEKITNDDVARKRKKTTNNITESVASKPVTEEVEVVGANKSQSSADDSFWPDATETNLHDLLKLKISKLCEVLGLSEEVKTTVERFLEYVIENYHVNNEHANTLQAFLISLCWSGSELLKHKLDRTQSIAIANEHLNFSCNEEETHNIYLKLESAKEMFIRYTKNQKKTYVSEDSIPETEPTSIQPLDVKEEIPDSPPSQYNDNVVDCNHIHAEIGTINPDTSDALENQNDFHILNNSNSPSAGVSKENTPSVQRVVSPASGQSVPTDPEIQKETSQENEVQVNSSSFVETSCLQTIGAGKVDQLKPEGSSLQIGMGQCSPSVASPQVAEIHSTTTTIEQRSDSYSADKVDCQPSYKPPSPSQNLSASSQVLETSARVPNPAVTPRGSNLLNVQRFDNRNKGVSRPYSDPLQNEMEKLCELKNNILKFHEVVKMRLKSDHEKELEEVIAEMNRKYESKCQEAEAAFQSKRVEIDASFNKVVKNKILADIFKSKCQDMSPFDPAVLRVQSGRIQFQGQPSMGRSTSLSPAQVSRIPQQPPLQIVHQPPPNINPITPSSRPPPNINPITPSSRPPPSNNLTDPFARNPRAISEVRAPAPHIRPFTPSTSTSHNLSSHRMMSSHHASSPTSQSSTRPPHLSPLQTPPHLQTNHNGHPTQNSPSTQPFSSLLAAQTSSQSPAASLALPPLYTCCFSVKFGMMEERVPFDLEKVTLEQYSIIGQEEEIVVYEDSHSTKKALGTNEPFVGQCFLSEEEALVFYKNYATIKGFSVRKGRFDNDKGERIRRDFLCHREGSSETKVIDSSKQQRNSRSKRCECDAHMRIKLRKINESLSEMWRSICMDDRCNYKVDFVYNTVVYILICGISHSGKKPTLQIAQIAILKFTVHKLDIIEEFERQ
ncbi:helicase [Artemisia annua]|uniref:Helicase n=1 Tax=Artemisia annua TaxID=35608 RepID=A0A2U1P0K7_ARTAN|nr:helicase [Artemisia annua]